MLGFIGQLRGHKPVYTRPMVRTDSYLHPTNDLGKKILEAVAPGLTGEEILALEHAPTEWLQTLYPEALTWGHNLEGIVNVLDKAISVYEDDPAILDAYLSGVLQKSKFIPNRNLLTKLSGDRLQRAYFHARDSINEAKWSQRIGRYSWQGNRFEHFEALNDRIYDYIFSLDAARYQSSPNPPIMARLEHNNEELLYALTFVVVAEYCKDRKGKLFSPYTNKDYWVLTKDFYAL